MLKKNSLSEYPCADYLHNALRFLEEGHNTNAYTEICYAVIKSGGKLDEHEEYVFKKLCKGKPTIGGELKKPTNIEYPWAECPECSNLIDMKQIKEYIEHGCVTYCHHCGTPMDWIDWSVDDDL